MEANHPQIAQSGAAEIAYFTFMLVFNSSQRVHRTSIDLRQDSFRRHNISFLLLCQTTTGVHTASAYQAKATKKDLRYYASDDKILYLFSSDHAHWGLDIPISN